MANDFQKQPVQYFQDAGDVSSLGIPDLSLEGPSRRTAGDDPAGTDLAWTTDPTTFKVYEAHVKLREDIDEGGYGLRDLQAQEVIARYLASLVSPLTGTVFDIDAALASPERPSWGRIIAEITGLPEYGHAEAFGRGFIGAAPEAVAGAAGARAGMELARLGTGVIPRALSKQRHPLLRLLGIGLAGIGGGWGAIEAEKKHLDPHLPEIFKDKDVTSDMLPGDVPAYKAGETLAHFGAMSTGLRGLFRKIPERLDLGTQRLLENLRKMQDLPAEAGGRMWPLSRFVAPPLGLVERSMTNLGRMSRGEIPGYIVQEGAITGGAAIGAGVAEAVDPGDPLTAFMGQILGPAGPVSLATRFGRAGAGAAVAPFRGVPKADPTAPVKAETLVGRIGRGVTGKAKSINQEKASRELDKWIENSSRVERSKARAAAQDLQNQFVTSIAEQHGLNAQAILKSENVVEAIMAALPAQLSNTQKLAIVEAAQTRVAEENKLPASLVADQLANPEALYIPITRESLIETIQGYGKLQEELYGKDVAQRLARHQLPGQVGETEEVLPLLRIPLSLMGLNVSARGTAARGRPDIEKSGEFLAQEYAGAMDEQTRILTAHLFDQLVTSGSPFNIELASKLAQAQFEERFMARLLPVGEDGQPLDEGLFHVLRMQEVARGRGGDWLPTPRREEEVVNLLFDTVGNLYKAENAVSNKNFAAIDGTPTFYPDHFVNAWNLIKNPAFQGDRYVGGRSALEEILRKSSSASRGILTQAGARPPPELDPLLVLKDKYSRRIEGAKQAYQEPGVARLSPEKRIAELTRRAKLEVLNEGPTEPGATMPTTGPPLSGGAQNLVPNRSLLTTAVREELIRMRDSLQPGGQMLGRANPAWFREMQRQGWETIDGKRWAVLRKSSVENTQKVINKALEGGNLGRREAAIARYVVNIASENILPTIRLSPSRISRIEADTPLSKKSLNSMIEWSGSPFGGLPVGTPSTVSQLMENLKKDIEKLGLDISPRQALTLFDDAEVASREAVVAGPVGQEVEGMPFIEGAVGSGYPAIPVSPISLDNARALMMDFNAIGDDIAPQYNKAISALRNALDKDFKDLAEGKKEVPRGEGEMIPPSGELMAAINFKTALENVYTRIGSGERRQRLNNPHTVNRYLEETRLAADLPRNIRVFQELGAIFNFRRSVTGPETQKGEREVIGPRTILPAEKGMEAMVRKPAAESAAAVYEDFLRGAMAEDVFEVLNPKTGQYLTVREAFPALEQTLKVAGAAAARLPAAARAEGNEFVSQALVDFLKQTEVGEFPVVRVNQQKLTEHVDFLNEIIIKNARASGNPKELEVASEMLEMVRNVAKDMKNHQTAVNTLIAYLSEDNGLALDRAAHKSLSALWGVENSERAAAAAMKSGTPIEDFTRLVDLIKKLKNSETRTQDASAGMEVRGADVYEKIKTGLFNDLVSIGFNEAQLLRPGKTGYEPRPYVERTGTRRARPGMEYYSPAQAAHDFFFNTAMMKSPGGTGQPLYKSWPEDQPLIDFLIKNDMATTEQKNLLNQFLEGPLGLIRAEEIFAGQRTGITGDKTLAILAGQRAAEAAPGKPALAAARMAGAFGASGIQNRLKAWFPWLGGTGTIQIPGIGAGLAADAMNSQPRTLHLAFLQNLFRPGRQEELIAFLSEPSPLSDSILTRMMAELTGGSPAPLSALTRYLTEEDVLEERIDPETGKTIEEERGWPERLGLSQKGALSEPPPQQVQPPPPPPPPPQARVQPLPDTTLSQASPSVNPQQQRDMYAAMFPFDPTSDILRQRQAQAPAQRGIGSLV